MSISCEIAPIRMRQSTIYNKSILVQAMAWCRQVTNPCWTYFDPDLCGHITSLDQNGITLRLRHNDHAGVSNHQPHGCLLNRLFRRKSKKTSKLRVTGLCVGNSPGTGEFPAQMTSYAENVSIWWRHHDLKLKIYPLSMISVSILNVLKIYTANRAQQWYCWVQCKW